MRESGLKSENNIIEINAVLSLSMRESGLKYDGTYKHVIHLGVSLHAREWIEIMRYLITIYVVPVSLHAREWIEINCWDISETLTVESLSMRESGLKSRC